MLVLDMVFVLVALSCLESILTCQAGDSVFFFNMTFKSSLIVSFKTVFFTLFYATANVFAISFTPEIF